MSVLLAVERGRTTLSAELERVHHEVASPRDRALVVEFCSGTLRWQARLDALLSPCSRRPIPKLSPAVRTILRLSAYQLEHLDRVPAHAVLNEAVALTRRFRESSASGFVNGVLRTFGRTRAQLSLPARPAPDAAIDDQVTYLSTTLSHPRWLVERWLGRYGFEATERWCQFNNAAPAVTVRAIGPLDRDALLHQLRQVEIDATPARVVADAISLPPGALGHVPSEILTQMLVQDEASQAVAHVAGAAPGERVLDLCAAPGGKTTVVDAAMRGQGLLVASDFRAGRVNLLARAVRHAGLRAHVVALDAARPLPFGAVFDCVIVDAPCSGLGVLRRDPDLKWSRQPGDLPGLAKAECRILAQAADAVAPGGRLIYATCSSEPDENDDVVERFLASDDRFSRDPLRAGAMLLDKTLVDAGGVFRTLPFRDGLDAFFAAAMRKSRT